MSAAGPCFDVLGVEEGAVNVDYVHSANRKFASNIIWQPSFPMRHGKFPKTHPCYGMAEPFMLMGEKRTADEVHEIKESDDALARFRALGYEASCFPEGDGITLDVPDHKLMEDVINDIQSCFGWKVTKSRVI